MKMLLLLSALLFSACLPFRGSSQERMPEEEPFAEAINADSLAFVNRMMWGDSSKPERTDGVNAREPVAPVVQNPGVQNWPKDENIIFTVNDIPRLDKGGRRTVYDVEMQWRQVCPDKDSDWYNMKSKTGLDAFDDDYGYAQGIALDVPDTITVWVKVMKEIDPHNSCEWRFRSRLRMGRRYSAWDEISVVFKLVEHQTQIITKPRMGVVQ